MARVCRNRSAFTSSTSSFSTVATFILFLILLTSTTICKIQAHQQQQQDTLQLKNSIISSTETFTKSKMSSSITTTTSGITSSRSISDRSNEGENHQNSIFQAAKLSRKTILAFASSSSPIPPPPPISMPVWSLATPIPPSLHSSSPQTEKETSMNVLTFATPLSVAPPKLWAISLYHDTLTKDAFVKTKVGVLQLLRPSQKHLIEILGKRSGYENGYSKWDECAKLCMEDGKKGRSMEWMKHGRGVVGDSDDNDEDEDAFISKEDRIGAFKSLYLLPNCASYIQLKLINVVEAGDHDVAICEVVKTGVWDDDRCMVIVASEPSTPKDYKTVLYTGQLREEGII